MTRIYIYDHCPFCVRATMTAGYKSIDYKLEVLLNDDEQSCYDLIGKKMLPVLQKGDLVMGESLDICQKLDEIGDPTRIIEPRTELTDQVEQLLAPVARERLALNFPRIINVGLPEFATASAREYYRGKKEQIIKESFEQALAKTEQYATSVAEALAALPHLTRPSERNGRLSWDDIFIYPHLRSLTVVKGLVIPDSVNRYLKEVAELTGGDLYTDRAI